MKKSTAVVMDLTVDQLNIYHVRYILSVFSY